jgi:hypothetical protein
LNFYAILATGSADSNDARDASGVFVSPTRERIPVADEWYVGEWGTNTRVVVEACDELVSERRKKLAEHFGLSRCSPADQWC